VLRTRTRLTRDEGGFTLIELLIVMLIIGILAAIAIPTFLGHSEKAQDASAKSDARNLVAYVDSCFVPSEDFTKCTSQIDVEAPDVNWGTGPGQVSVVKTTADSYEVTAVSEAKTDGVNNKFTVKRATGSGIQRTCTGGDGCKNGTW
jgi:type IV pilus assembly protein PilA